MRLTVKLVRSLFLLATLILMISGLPLYGLLPTAAQPSQPEGLLRLEIQNDVQRQELVERDVQIYARLFTDDGTEVLFLPGAALPEAPSLRSAQQVDPGAAGRGYYLAWTADEADREAAREAGVLVEAFGPQALLAGTPEQIEALEADGIHSRPLEPYTLREYTLAPEALAINPDGYVGAMIGQVSQSTLIQYVSELSGAVPVTIGSSTYTMHSRFTPNEDAITKATRYVHDHLEALGLQTYYHYYDLFYNGTDYGERRNVIAEQPGVVHPEQIFLVTAHMDSRSETVYPPSWTSYYTSPGADDNASGTAAVMAAADILSQHTFEYTIRYVLFTGEEQLWKGSQPYAAEVAGRNEQLLGVLNLDMIGYDTGGRGEFELHVRPGEGGDRALAETYRDVAGAYGLPLNPVILSDSLSFSDHSSFWTYDYPAVLGMEDYINPNWHRTSDTVGTLDRGYYTAAAKAAVGTLAHLARFYAPNVSGTITHSDALASVPGALVTLSDPGFNQTVSTGADGSYLFMAPGGVYNLTVQADGFAPQTIAGVSVPDPLSGDILDLDVDLCQLLAGVSWAVHPLPPQPGETVTLTAGYLAGSPPFTYAWEVDGTAWPAPAPPVITHTFTEAGNRPVVLTISNGCGAATASFTLPVGGQVDYLPTALQAVP